MNPEQQAAVNLTEGPVICVAGPGSGKTTVIVGRVRHMIDDLGIEPSNILVVTFTKAAAVSMRTRFLSGADKRSEKVNFGTFHSIFYHILKDYYGYTGENILKEETAFDIMSKLLSGNDLFLSGSPDFVNGMLDEIGLYKGLDFDQKGKFSSSLVTTDNFRRIYRAYQATLDELKLIDFEDMLQKTWELLATDENARKKWQNKFRYILVDEFQDINPIQYRITRLLAQPENNLFVVGDDDQSIYSFRGAAPGIMASFPSDYPDAKIVRLNLNYRSTPEILERALSVIGNNSGRYDKKLKAVNPSGESVCIKNFREAADEYQFLCNRIKSSIEGGRAPKEIAVLVRTNSQAGGICTRLLDAGIPFTTKAGIPSIFDNRHVRPMLSYLRFAAGDNSRNTFLQIMNKPVRYIEKASLTDTVVDLSELLDYYHSQDKDYVMRNISTLMKDICFLQTLSPAPALRYIRDVIGYDNYLKSSSGLSDEMLGEIFDVFDEVTDAAGKHRNAQDFFAHIEKHKEKLKLIREQHPINAVNILTFHGCKGLEFDEVYMPDCEEDITPHKKCTAGDASHLFYGTISEERRMFYVAMTRARLLLTVTSSSKRNGREMICSRFMNEMKRAKKIPAVGTKVYHSTYKEGTVIHTDGDHLTIKFDKILVPKKISFGYCVEKGLLTIY